MLDLIEKKLITSLVFGAAILMIVSLEEMLNKMFLKHNRTKKCKDFDLCNLMTLQNLLSLLPLSNSVYVTYLFNSP